ncbi:MAG: kelch repeat-containing protein [Deltaproteobacteria bacterium]|nr:kelch repeat-containing protein [Deltaproteobacteria bacterium]
MISQAEVSPADASIGMIEGCPARGPTPGGSWQSVGLPEDFSARANPSVVVAGDAIAVLGGFSERTVVLDNWLLDTRTSRWSRLASGGFTAQSRSLVVVWMPEVREIFVWSNIEHRGTRMALDGTSRELSSEGAPVTVVRHAVSVAGSVFAAASTTLGDHDEFALYDPRTDRWEPVLAPREQTSRGNYSLVATDRAAIVWGGIDAVSDPQRPRNDGWRFDLPTRTWSSVSQRNAPAPRSTHAAWWIGDSMLVWSGQDRAGVLQSGGRYFVGPDAWLAMDGRGAPDPGVTSGTYAFSTAWTGSDLLVWALTPDGRADAGRYVAREDRWAEIEPPPDARRRRESSTVWVDCGLYVVGGRDVMRWEFTREVLRWSP